MPKRKVKDQSNKTDGEPMWKFHKGKKPHKTIEIVRSFNWYNSNEDEKHAAKYLGVSDKALAKRFMTLAFATRMIARGCKFSETSMKNLEAMRVAFEDEEEEKKPDNSEVVSIQERIRNKSEEIIGEMQGLIDDYGLTGSANDMNAYQWMIDRDIKSVHANRIIEHFRESSREVFAAASGKDLELVEAYEGYSKARLLNLLKCYANIIQDAGRLSQNTKTANKPRKKKPISFDKKVSKLKYKKDENSLKLRSLDPVKIIGAAQLWVYNSKTRKLGVYNALDGSGLDVKGSTIKNFGSDSSISKKLRKPEIVLPTVVDGGKVTIRKVMDEIRAKPIKMTGRINKDTLILRVS